MAKVKIIQSDLVVELEDPDRSISSLFQLALAALDNKTHQGVWLPEPPEQGEPDVV